MSNTDIEIVVDDPTAPDTDSPAITSTRAVDVVVSLLLFALAVTLGYDNWRTGAGWESTGPQPGYFPFYLSIILACASLYGLVAAYLSRKEARAIVADGEPPLARIESQSNRQPARNWLVALGR